MLTLEMALVGPVGYLDRVLIIVCFGFLARRLGVDSHKDLCIDRGS